MEPTLETLQVEFDALTRQLKELTPMDAEYQKLWDDRVAIRRKIIELRHEENSNQ